MAWLHRISAVLLLATAVLAGHPQVTAMVPRGGQRGTEVTLTVHGARLQDLAGLVLFRPGIEVLEVLPERANRGKIRIRIAKDCPLGAHEVLVRTKLGLSSLQLFMVGTLPERGEKEPNQDREHAEKIPLNVTVNGRITAEDVDVFAVPVQRGQRIRVEVQGLRLGDGEFDPHLTIHDDRGTRVAQVDDTIFGQMDPLASLACERDGTWFLSLRESARGGSNTCFYRLHVGTFPRPLVAFPAGGQPGTDLVTRLIGDGDDLDATIHLPDRPGLHKHFVQTAGGTAPTPIYLAVTGRPNVFETKAGSGAKGSKSGPWHTLGPFANPRGKGGASRGHTTVYPPEQDSGATPDRKAKFTGRDGPLVWTRQPKLRDHVTFDLRSALGKTNDSVVYLSRTITAPTPRRVLFLCSGDDTLKVWLNGKVIGDDPKPSPAQAGQHRLLLDLRAGGNQLLVKVSNRDGACAFYNRLLDPQRLAGYTYLTGPCALNGVIDADGQTDRFVFLAKKGQGFDFQAVSRRLRSPLDPVLGCSCSHDRFYVGNDDTNGIGMDSLLRFRAPFTGEFLLTLRDMLQSGSPEHVYRIEVSPPTKRRLTLYATLPGYRYEWTVSVPAGGRDAVMISTANLDQGAGVQLSFEGLPPGVTATAPILVRGTTSVPVVFHAEAGRAPVGELVTVHAKATAKKLDLSDAVFYQPVEIVQSRNQRTYLTNPVDRLPVAVTAAPQFTLEVPPVRVPLVRGSPIRVPFKLVRSPGYAQNVRVRMLYNPAGITSNQVDIAKDKDSGVLTLYANNGVRIGSHPIVLVGMGTVRGAPVSSSSELVDLEVSAPWMTATVGTVRTEPGHKVELPITFAAAKPFDGAIATEWLGLPRGVTCGPMTVERSTDKLTLPLTISAKAPPGRHRSFRLRLKIRTDHGWVVQEFRNGEIRIDRPKQQRTGS